MKNIRVFFVSFFAAIVGVGIGFLWDYVLSIRYMSMMDDNYTQLGAVLVSFGIFFVVGNFIIAWVIPRRAGSAKAGIITFTVYWIAAVLSSPIGIMFIFMGNFAWQGGFGLISLAFLFGYLPGFFISRAAGGKGDVLGAVKTGTKVIKTSLKVDKAMGGKSDFAKQLGSAADKIEKTADTLEKIDKADKYLKKIEEGQSH